MQILDKLNGFIIGLIQQASEQPGGCLAQRHVLRDVPATFCQLFAPSPGLSSADLTKDQQAKLLETMRRMLVCFRPDDVAATMKTIEDKNLVQRLFVSCYGGKYDIASDKVWDTWQIESPDFVWYFRGFPHIHGYFHLPV